MSDCQEYQDRAAGFAVLLMLNFVGFLELIVIGALIKSGTPTEPRFENPETAGGMMLDIGGIFLVLNGLLAHMLLN